MVEGRLLWGERNEAARILGVDTATGEVSAFAADEPDPWSVTLAACAAVARILPYLDLAAVRRIAVAVCPGDVALDGRGGRRLCEHRVGVVARKARDGDEQSRLQARSAL